jgi:hypothetical protein
MLKCSYMQIFAQACLRPSARERTVTFEIQIRLCCAQGAADAALAQLCCTLRS